MRTQTSVDTGTLLTEIAHACRSIGLVEFNALSEFLEFFKEQAT